MAFHEMSRRHRKEGDAEAVRQLLALARTGGAVVKEELVLDLEAWLEKQEQQARARFQ